ncbi:pentapeptide repeat-containing protein [Achromobacter seleniivolatilans]|uniref:pentapeptide repeat-containing protein n=1 Tax=Achromobacter seleniivolatilans TaxID=3047478 RepID=UPI0035292413
MQGALLMNAYFMRAALKGCNFTDAVLVGADFIRADLTGAKLSNSDVRFCSFKDATLGGQALGSSMWKVRIGPVRFTMQGRYGLQGLIWQGLACEGHGKINNR